MGLVLVLVPVVGAGIRLRRGARNETEKDGHDMRIIILVCIWEKLWMGRGGEDGVRVWLWLWVVIV